MSHETQQPTAQPAEAGNALRSADDAHSRLSEGTPAGYLVRVGVHGQVGKFPAVGNTLFPRRARVVCRTVRGVEVGEVLGSYASETPQESETGRAVEATDGRILRSMRAEDEMLWGHLEQLSQDAFEQCVHWLGQHDASAVLLDVEPLLDGRTLFFHFLSDVDSQTQQFVDELAAVYERQIRESEFAKLVEEGCGPGCGTEKAENGCGSPGGCAVCKVASACGASKR